MIALNEFNHTGVVAEIKRNPRKINLVELGEKVKVLPSEYGRYQLSLQGLSIEDM
jgi:hypothetical protein